MLNRQSVLAALAAAVLSVGTAQVAQAATASCWETCSAMYGSTFYAPDYFYDDIGQLGSPGQYYLVDCDDNWCYYSGGSAS